MSAAAVVLPMPVRRAQARDVKHASLSRWAVQVYRDLVLHVNAENICWPKIETQAKDLLVSGRTITKARNELFEKGWICYPQGDSGGRDTSKPGWAEPRGRGLRIHLHPDGCPCERPAVELKQRTAATAANEKRAQKRVAREGVKDEICSSLSQPEKDEICAVKDEIRADAYKEGTFSTGTIPKKPLASREQNAGDASLPPKKKPQIEQASSGVLERLQEPETVGIFQDLQRLLTNSLGPIGKVQILRAAEEHGFSLPLLLWAFREHGSGLNQAGGLVRFAAEWPTYTAGLQMPQCLQCLDSGAVACLASPFDGLAPCECAAGQKQTQGRFKHYAAWLANPEFCVQCGDTGEELYGDDCLCEAGRQRGEQRDIERTRRKALEERGVCTFCEGTGTWADMSGKECFVCKGTGKRQAAVERTASRNPLRSQYLDSQ